MKKIGNITRGALQGIWRTKKYARAAVTPLPRVGVVGGVIRIGATDGSKGFFPSHEEVCVLPLVVWIQSRADAGLMARMGATDANTRGESATPVAMREVGEDARK